MANYASYDDKGKVFTHVISKKPVPVIIQTNTHRIEGNIHVRPDHRLKDELDAAAQFIAVTDATVFDATNAAVARASFLAVHSSQIVWLVPVEEQ